MLPPLDAPEGLPWIGEEGSDAFGYPLRRPDPIGLQTLLRQERFDALEGHCREIRAAYEADFRKERWLDDMLSAFDTSDPRLSPLFDAWIAEQPASSAALLARGAYHRALAWNARGGGSIRDVSASQLAAFRAELALARTDTEAGVGLDAHNVAGWIQLHTVAREQSDAAGAASALARAKLECPACIGPYEHEIRFLEPRWGGSYAAMDALAEQAAAHIRENAALALLRGFSRVDRCLVATRAENYPAALRACNEALETGAHPSFLARRAKLFIAMGRFADALDDADAALRLKPSSAMALEARYTALIAKDQYGPAADTVLRLLYLDPAGATAAALASHASRSLTFGAHGISETDRDRALSYLDFALMFDPYNGDAARLHGYVLQYQRNPGNPAHLSFEQVAERAAAEPDSFNAQRDYDMALLIARRVEDIVPVWTAYIARHPDDGRAYRERSGTYSLLGNADAALQDARRGCELGDGIACRHAGL